MKEIRKLTEEQREKYSNKCFILIYHFPYMTKLASFYKICSMSLMFVVFLRRYYLKLRSVDGSVIRER
jgi:hypothetical protein